MVVIFHDVPFSIPILPNPTPSLTFPVLHVVLPPRPWVPCRVEGGGSWGTLRISREDWGTPRED